jgi:dTDP-glucose 4,6-dehydratase/UDP-glucose 4-epimerase
VKRILIIGSAGFIGSNAYKTWAASDKHEVWGADVVACPAQARFFAIDAENPNFTAIFAAQSFDACLNCSGAAQVGQSFEQPQKDYELNTRNVFAILEAIRLHSPDCKFINLSSAAVYGNPPAVPVLENMPLRPLSPYGYHKKMAEDICISFAQNFGLKTCALRIFSAYGEGLRKQLFWDIVQKAAKNADKIELWGTGEESRDFIYIQDLIAVFEAVLAGANFKGEAINVGSGIEISIRYAAQTLLSAIDYEGEIEFSQQQKIGDPLRWLADISQLTALGFRPKYSLVEGLQNYAQWLRLEYKD